MSARTPITIKVPKDEMLDILYESEDGVIISDVIEDNSRWSITHVLTFKYKDGHAYQTWYSVGATECQDEGPWECEDEVECRRVAEVEKLVKVWEPIYED